jgi:flagellar biosynthesis component FlhA
LRRHATRIAAISARAIALGGFSAVFTLIVPLPRVSNRLFVTICLALIVLLCALLIAEERGTPAGD